MENKKDNMENKKDNMENKETTIVFYSAVHSSAFDKVKINDQITITDYIPAHTSFGEALAEIEEFTDANLKEIMLLKLEVNTSELLSQAIDGFNSKGGELSVKVLDVIFLQPQSPELDHSHAGPKKV